MADKYVDEIVNELDIHDGGEILRARHLINKAIRKAQLDVLNELYGQRQAIKMYNGGFEDVVILPYIEERINKLKDKLKEGK